MANLLTRRVNYSPYHVNEEIFTTSQHPHEQEEISCYGDACPLKGVSQVNDDEIVGIIPYFNWIGDSFLLLEINQERFSYFSPNSEEYLNKYLDPEERMLVSHLIWTGKNKVVLFIKYRQITIPFDKTKRRTTQDNIALVQLSRLKTQKPRSSSLDDILPYLPANL